MAAIQDLESLIDRSIDEVDVLNILEGHFTHLLVQVPVDTKKTSELLACNVQHRVNRTNERVQLVTLLRNHLETERLQRRRISFTTKKRFFLSGAMTLQEWTALVLEDIPKFERLTNLQLTDDDLRIISMNRFASLERSLARPMTDSEYRHLLQTDSPLDYIEEELLKRPLTTDERMEQEELTFALYQTPTSDGKMAKILAKENLELTHTQLEHVMHSLHNHLLGIYP